MEGICGTLQLSVSAVADDWWKIPRCPFRSTGDEIEDEMRYPLSDIEGTAGMCGVW